MGRTKHKRGNFLAISMLSSAKFNEANANRVETSKKQKNCPKNGPFTLD